MALTATILLATFAVFDSMAVPLAADSSTEATSTFSSDISSSWATDTMSSSTLTFSTTAVATTSSSAVSDTTLSSQSSVSASPTESQSASSSSVPSSSSSSDPLPTTIISTAYAAAPTVTVTAPPQTVTDTITIVPPPTPAPTLVQTAWSAPPQMTDMSAFAIKNFAYGHQNMRIIVNSPPSSSANDSDISSEALTNAQVALASAANAGKIPSPPDANSTFLQLLYPANSINPAQEPQGGADFYATPLDLSSAKNISMEYSVFFPADFDFVHGGKLPGVYGGHDGCSGGDDALECFSTRLMWRAKGLGELYLYAPKDKQTAALCATPPQSVCDADWGLSIARGAFTFTLGNWTHVRQTVTLNTPGMQDGGFALDVNGRRVIERCDVYYRGAPQAADPETASASPIPPVADLSGTQDDFIKGPFHLKVDSVLAKVNVGRDFTPTFAPYSGLAPDSQDSEVEDFTPAFAPPGALSPSPDIKAADPPPPSASPETETATTVMSTTTVVPATQTITLYPTTTETAYAMAMESGAPFAEEAVADPKEPIGFTGLFFSTFFGGHEAKYATPKDQFTWFRDFAMTINA
ncbi:hypothetical protein TRAPUB_10437 [Trametes pubescens]|uniref:Polysaccharide lyase 14 domain-containing protein n=1 Tax=Trametes pubescens TaxID=154538 RepID=A0A1M2VZL4_TRAPU|nr:hypothetical protein TRAPUB_10437 [Trametes pubescens]